MSVPPAPHLLFGHIELRPAERRVFVDGQAVALGSRAFDLLSALVAKRDRVVSKNELLDEVWPGLVVEENNLQVQISGLRRVLGAQAIATVQGMGYRFTLVESFGAGRGVAADSAAGAATLPGQAQRHDQRHDQQPDSALTWSREQARDAAPLQAGSATAADVLVADDNKVNRLLLCRSLELMGHRVSSAENGRQALEMLRQRPFALLLLDLAMPELDGFALLQVRAGDAALQEVSVIVTSALDGVAPVVRCIELGADDFLHKPVDPWLLRARVDSSLARKQAQDAQREALRRLSPDLPAQARRIDDATILVARLHGLEATAPAPTPTPEPQQTMEMLGDWCTLVLDAIDSHGGELTQFNGDGVTALFAQPGAAVRAAQDMVALTALFNVERMAMHQVPVGFGVGVARGAVLLGAVLTSQRQACTCLGAPVQMAENLAIRCPQLEQALLMDTPTCAGLATEVRTVRVMQADGVAAYTLAAASRTSS